MRNRTVGINVRVTVTEKKKVTLFSKKCGLSLSEYLRQRALGAFCGAQRQLVRWPTAAVRR